MSTDINRDGFPDVIVGCMLADNYAGSSYVVYGNHGSLLTNLVLSTLTSKQGFKISGAYSYDYSGAAVSGAADSKGNSIVAVGAPLSNSFKGSAYVIMNSGSFPNMNTFSPSVVPSSCPSGSPSSRPSQRPSPSPTPVPTRRPSLAPTPPPFWISNGPLILGVVGPAVLGFIPIFFSKQICFRVLDNWGSLIDQNQVQQVKKKRSRFKAFVYTGCKRMYLEQYTSMKLAKEEKERLDEATKSDIEMMSTLLPPKEVVLVPGNRRGSADIGADSIDSHSRRESSSIPLVQFRKTELPNALGRNSGEASSSSSQHQQQSQSVQDDVIASPGTRSQSFSGNPMHTTRASSSYQLSDSDDEEDGNEDGTAEGGVNGEAVGESHRGSDPLGGTTGHVHKTYAVFSIRYDNDALNMLGTAATMPLQPESSLKQCAVDLPPLHHKQKLPFQSTTFRPAHDNDVAAALLTIRNLLEHLPVLAHWQSVIGIHMAANNSTQIPSVLTAPSNLQMIALHFLAGHAAALWMPREMLTQSLFYSTASSTVYAARLLAVDTLNANHQQGRNTSSYFYKSQQCALVMAVHLVPTLTVSAVKALTLQDLTSAMDGFLTSSTALSVALGGSECYRIMHSADPLRVKDNSHTLNEVTSVLPVLFGSALDTLPWLCDAIAVVYYGRRLKLQSTQRVMQIVAQLLALTSRVTTVDYLSRGVVDVIRHNKRYVGEVWRYAVKVFFGSEEINSPPEGWDWF